MSEVLLERVEAAAVGTDENWTSKKDGEQAKPWAGKSVRNRKMYEIRCRNINKRNNFSGFITDCSRGYAAVMKK